MTLEEVYALIPSIDCKGKCAASCGPILVSPGEAVRLPTTFRVLRTPSGWRAAEIPHTVKRGRKRCVLLRNGRCTAYEVRPAVCRLWGVMEGLLCPYGCVPERVLTRAEGFEVLHRVRLVGAGLG